jgi:hypothetical protein
VSDVRLLFFFCVLIGTGRKEVDIAQWIPVTGLFRTFISWEMPFSANERSGSSDKNNGQGAEQDDL